MLDQPKLLKIVCYLYLWLDELDGQQQSLKISCETLQKVRIFGFFGPFQGGALVLYLVLGKLLTPSHLFGLDGE